MATGRPVGLLSQWLLDRARIVIAPWPRADFYLIAKERFREPNRCCLVCELARKAHDAGLWTLVLARDAAQAEQLDDLLWDMGEDAYIPHQIAGDDEDEADAGADRRARHRRAAAPAGDQPARRARSTGSFDRVLEVVPADDSARGPLRERWKQYQARGLELKKYDM